MFTSTSGCSGAKWSPPASVTGVRPGVSPVHPFGVSPPAVLLLGVKLVPLPSLRLPSGPGVMTCVKFLPASRIQSRSSLSSAVKYSCWACDSNNPGKKSRAIMCDSASVYTSSSSTLAGRFCRFGGGGGSMRVLSVDRLASACDGEPTIATSSIAPWPDGRIDVEVRDAQVQARVQCSWVMPG